MAPPGGDKVASGWRKKMLLTLYRRASNLVLFKLTTFKCLSAGSWVIDLLVTGNVGAAMWLFGLHIFLAVTVFCKKKNHVTEYARFWVFFFCIESF